MATIYSRLIAGLVVFILGVFLAYTGCIKFGGVYALGAIVGAITVTGMALGFFGLEGLKVGGGASAALIVLGLFISLISTVDRGRDMELMTFFIYAQSDMMGAISPEGKKIAEHGMRLCALQFHVDVVDFTIELQKALRLGPITSMAVDATGLLADSIPSKASCLSALAAMHKLHPEITKPLVGGYLAVE